MTMNSWHRYRCPCCAYEYDERRGDMHEGFAPGTRWEAIAEDWACPNCAVREKPDFELLPGTEDEGPSSVDDLPPVSRTR